MVEQLSAALSQLARFHSVQLADEFQKLSAAEFFIDKRPIRNKTGDRFGLLRVDDHVMPIEQNLPRSRFQNSHHDPDRCRFAGAVGTEKAENFSGRHREIELIDSGELAIVLAQVNKLNHSILDFRFSEWDLNLQSKMAIENTRSFLQDFDL